MVKLRMRIDKFLKVSRLLKRRETARRLAVEGGVYLNGKKVKPSAEVEAGDKLVLELGRHRLECEILEIRPYASKEQAGSMYRLVSDTLREEEGC